MGIACWVGVALFVALPAEDPRAQAEQIFAVIDSAAGTATSPATVLQQLKKLAPKPQADYRVQYAYGVALAHEKRYVEALAVAERLVQQRPTFLPAHRLRVWLLITLRKQREALTALQQLAVALPKAELEEDAEEKCAEAARFLGVAIGFFAGPGIKQTTPTTLDTCRARVEKSLPPNRRAAFDEGLAEVKDRTLKKVTTAQAIPTAKDEERITELTGKQADLEKFRADVKRQTEDNEQQLRKYWDKLREEGQRTAANYDELARQAAIQDQAYQQAAFALQQLSAAYTNAKPSDQNNLTLRNNLLYATRAESVLANQLIQTQAGMEQLMRYANRIEGQMSAVVVEAQRLGLAFAEQEQVLKQQSEGIAHRRKKHEANITAKERRQNQRQATFSEYEELSYSAEKQRVLDATEPE